MKCLMLDYSLLKAYKQIVHRLSHLGWRVVRAPRVPSLAVLEMAKKAGCILVTADKLLGRRGACYVDMEYAGKKSSRDLAQHIIAACLPGADVHTSL